jgi:hypothetical protein
LLPPPPPLQPARIPETISDNAMLRRCCVAMFSVRDSN